MVRRDRHRLATAVRSCPSACDWPTASSAAPGPGARSRRPNPTTSSRDRGRRDARPTSRQRMKGRSAIVISPAIVSPLTRPGAIRHRCPGRLESAPHWSATSSAITAADRARPGLDVGGALLAPTGVHPPDLAADGRIEHAHMTVGIASDVRRDVTDGPARQQRRAGHVEVSQVPQRRDHQTVGARRTGSVAVDIVHRVLTVYGTRTWQPCGHANRNGRSRAHGRQHGSPAAARRPRLRRLRPRTRPRCRPRRPTAHAVRALRRRSSMHSIAPRHIWLMVPAAYVGSTIDAFAPLLSPGDTLIDGGNSWYRDDVDRAGPLRARRASTTSTSAPAAACSGSNAATA